MNKVFGHLTQPRTLVLGLGESGLAMAQWLARHHAPVTVADTRTTPPYLNVLRDTVPQAHFINDVFEASLLDQCDLIAISPGLSPLDVSVSNLLATAKEKNIPVWGEIELFALALAALKEAQSYEPKVIAITGTNGKTTTTSLTGLLCERAGKSVAVAGNISPAALNKLSHAIDHHQLPAIWVLELSSFQLETTYTLNPDAATILNITQDHLDWHGNMQAYANAKARIFGNETQRVLNRDDALVMAYSQDAALTFGLHEPNSPQEYGLVKENGLHWLAYGVPTDEPVARKRGKQIAKQEVMIQKLMPVNALKIRGLHNATNALAALALCRAIGLPLASLLHGLREYAGEPHRVQWIATINDVEYYDDSKGTNVGATVAALHGLSKSLVLIAGGDGKGQDFSPLSIPVARYCKAVLLIGRDAPVIQQALVATQVELIHCNSLETAVLTASRIAQAGEAILLSPACASLDMFKNYAHRAQVFASAVAEVASDAGVML